MATWTRTDLVLQLQTDSSGNVQFVPSTNIPIYAPAYDATTGGNKTDQNIYARYFTDEVQRITLPAEVLNNSLPANARMTLTADGSEIQKLSVTATYQPYSGGQSNIEGQFEVFFDANMNNVMDPAEHPLVQFRETDMAGNALRLQQALRGIPAGLPGQGNSSAVTVSVVNSHEYLIDFGVPIPGQPAINQPEIVIPPSSVSFTSGFFPAVLPSTVREPVTILNIPISPTNPRSTAVAIETYFAQTATDIPIGPIDYPPTDEPSPGHRARTSPEILRTPVPQVSVIPVLGVDLDGDGETADDDGRVFDIHFTGADGKKDHPELIVAALTDEFGASILDPLADYLRTVKEPSTEFRVNPAEADDPFTPYSDVVHQRNPVVAMDPDGDFVITWESVVPDSVLPNSVSDIYAKRYTPFGLIGQFDPTDAAYDAAAAENFGVVTTGIRALVAPDAQVTQRLKLDATVGGVVTGTFRLRIGDGNLETGEIENIIYDSTLAGNG